MNKYGEVDDEKQQKTNCDQIKRLKDQKLQQPI